MTDDELPQETVLWQRQNLAVANILAIKDRIEHLLDPNDASRLRAVVMREIGELTELACAIVRAQSDGQVMNGVYLDMLREIHLAVVRSPDGAAAL